MTEEERGRDAWLRRQAMQIATQLPEKAADARIVLRYMSELLDDFLTPKRDEEDGHSLQKKVVSIQR
ncbi:hypothetical protein [Allomesorhizobium alhagi]|uniref:Uncharacterized protein n=1 Tax=Mesorhizobium alhagi CCNWXJ12-2 TaxID=1107882 RepID=H0HNK7_9HYPH|nr:hypothetical protein [Mesorhizobium alhagi]EHK57660.1 hypothetical protein MAXJ12_08649 [Mesorhizobium alhagi CCNWXJ12-2]